VTKRNIQRLLDRRGTVTFASGTTEPDGGTWPRVPQNPFKLPPPYGVDEKQNVCSDVVVADTLNPEKQAIATEKKTRHTFP